MKHDARVEKPLSIDPVVGFTSGGYVVIVQWLANKNHWYELATDETYGDVEWWEDFSCPKSWHISDDYYKE